MTVVRIRPNGSGGGGESVDIINDLNSDRTDAALSAKQGKVLHTEVTELEQNVGDLDDLDTTEKSNLVGAINEVKESIPSPITLDDNVTETSANGVKSSGIYAYVQGIVGDIETILAEI